MSTRRRPLCLLPLLLLVLSACGAGQVGDGAQLDPDPDSSVILEVDVDGQDDPGQDVPPDLPGDEADAPMDVATGEDAAPAEDVDPPEDAPIDDEPPPGERVQCTLQAPQGEQEVNTWMGNTARVAFTVNGVPDGVDSARLRYYAHDADHPGEEGWIEVNGGPRIALPAEEALDNAGRDFELDVSGQVVAGSNTIAFIAFDGPEGAFYRISSVSLVVEGLDLSCEDMGPTGEGVERTMHFSDATFEMRRNWVLQCRDYAYTARFDEHRACDDGYDPDGSGHGRAIFRFTEVVADRYEVHIEGRHTENRNPSGMLVSVNGAERRISQRDDAGLVFDLHGVYDLAGEVTVVIDSTREDGSDSVRSVRLRPAP